MKKIILIAASLLLTNCAYNPKIDTVGRSGTFDKSRAEQLTNDLVICRDLTDQNVNYFIEGYAYVHNFIIRPQTLWLIPKMEYKEKKIMNNCLTGRGHSVLTK
jgi:hypothetical protein